MSCIHNCTYSKYSTADHAWYDLNLQYSTHTCCSPSIFITNCNTYNTKLTTYNSNTRTGISLLESAYRRLFAELFGAAMQSQQALTASWILPHPLSLRPYSQNNLNISTPVQKKVPWTLSPNTASSTRASSPSISQIAVNPIIISNTVEESALDEDWFHVDLGENYHCRFCWAYKQVSAKAHVCQDCHHLKKTPEHLCSSRHVCPPYADGNQWCAWKTRSKYWTKCIASLKLLMW